MDYVRKFLHVEQVIGQGAFGRVLITSTLQNQQQSIVANGLQQQQQQRLRQQDDIAKLSLGEPGTGPITRLQQSNNSNNNDKSQENQQHSKSPETSPLKPMDISTNILGIMGNNRDSISNSCNNNPPTTRFALKCIHPILKPQRLASELRHLRDLGGRNNVVQMHTAHFHMGSLYIVMELIEHDRFVDIVSKLDNEEIVMYMRNLLEALEHVHSRNIMHRDIKPANFLFNRKLKKFLLVDFGLAQEVRIRSGLFGTGRPVSGAAAVGSTQHHHQSSSLVGTSPRPTNQPARRLINTTLFPDSKHDNRKNHNQFESHRPIPDSPFLNPKPALNNTISPARPSHNFHLTKIASPSTPNVSTKRHPVTETNDFNQMLKKLRVSNNDETKEPVKLTVGAYESPVTNNDSLTRSRINASNNHKFSTPKIPRRHLGARCDCRGKARTCSTCMSRPDSIAPRSGTIGFKAPEILLRCPNQTTAIDIWSAGVIMACLLSGHSPFFRDIEDTVSLAEVITIFGSQKLTEAARAIGIRLNIEPERQPIDLEHLCKLIRSKNKEKLQIDIPDEAFDLINRMLDPNPLTRITASEALTHPFFTRSPCQL